MDEHGTSDQQPRYIISVAASLANCHPQTLRHYERMGLLNPQRTRANVRMYTEEDIEQLRRIQRIIEDLGVNLAAVEVILNMRQQILDLQTKLEQMESRLQALERI